MNLPASAAKLVQCIPCPPAPNGQWLVAFRYRTAHGHQTPGFRFEAVVCWAHVTSRQLEPVTDDRPGISHETDVDALVAMVVLPSCQLGVANSDPDYYGIVPPGVQLQCWAAEQNARETETTYQHPRLGRGPVAPPR